jgi:predicted anti-sigma-YlaC factor YlaD
MRVRHLTDHEFQGLLDRRVVIVADDSVPGMVYRKDLDAQEHLDNCPACRGEMALYRALYGDLERVAVPSLSRNFARKVTFSLPPFKARRTRTRLQLGAAYGCLALIGMVWWLSRIDWMALAAKLVGIALPVYQGVHSALGTVTVWFPSLLASLLTLIPKEPSIFKTISTAFYSGAGSVHFVILATLVLAMIASLDRILLTEMVQRMPGDR